MRYLIILIAIFMSACSIVDDYSKGVYENNYVENNVDLGRNNVQEIEEKQDSETSSVLDDKEENKQDDKRSEKEILENKSEDKSDDKKSEDKIDDKKSDVTEQKADEKEESKESKDDDKKSEKEEIKFENKSKNKSDDKKSESSETKTIDLLNIAKNDPIEKSDINIDGLSNKALSWWYRPGKPISTIDKGVAELIAKYGAIWQKPTGQNKMYLTFDEGYEHNENTTSILNTLNEKNVKAAFFITGHFLKSRPDLVQRMVNEGHAVCNHTVDHMNPPKALANDKFVADVEGLEKLFNDTIGGNLSPFYRPPEGGYSEATLSAAKSLGYHTTFWSFAYKDWETKNQPDEDAAFNKITSSFHDGSVILLHAVSDTNTKILARVIDKAREMGYTFGDLNELR